MQRVLQTQTKLKPQTLSSGFSQCPQSSRERVALFGYLFELYNLLHLTGEVPKHSSLTTLSFI